MSKAQLDMFAPLEASIPPEPLVHVGDPVKVRIKLDKILAEAESAEIMPWDWRKQRLYQTIFPQMVRWLPDDEAADYVNRFNAEIERLG